MARPQKTGPGKLTVSIIHSSRDALADALSHLEKRFGRVLGETIDLSHTPRSECAEEMGQHLLRRFFTFEREVPRESLPEIKAACHKIESQFGDRIQEFTFRTVNIDPGILSPDNLVMASYREYNHRVYLGDGVYAEIELVYSRGRFVRLPWTDPEFCQSEVIELLSRTRNGFEYVARLDEPAWRF